MVRKGWPSDKANKVKTIVYDKLRILLALTDIKEFGRLNHIVTTDAASDWPWTFFTARVFLFKQIVAIYNIYSILHGRIKEKKSAIYSIKWQGGKYRTIWKV